MILNIKADEAEYAWSHREQRFVCTHQNYEVSDNWPYCFDCKNEDLTYDQAIEMVYPEFEEVDYE